MSQGANNGFFKTTRGAMVLLGLCAGTAPAQSTSYNLRQNGKFLGLYTVASGSNCWATASIRPGATEQNEDVYEVYWAMEFFGVSLNSLPTTCPNSESVLPWPIESVSMAVSGILDASEVKGNAGAGIFVDLDVSKLRTVIYAVRTECNYGNYYPCTDTPLQSFRFKGIFKPQTTGYGVQTFSNNGSRDSEYSDSVCKHKYSFSGSESGGTALFSGSIGPAAVTEPSVGSNASYNVQKGQLRSTYECNSPAATSGVR